MGTYDEYLHARAWNKGTSAMSEVVVIGLGQLGRVFAGGLLRTGHSVVPVNRGDDMAMLAQAHSAPERVLVAVAENDLHTVLAALPEIWKPRAALIQNELLPRDWLVHGYTAHGDLGVVRKKKGIDARPLIASPVAGRALRCCAGRSPPSICRAVKSHRATHCCSSWCAKRLHSPPTNIAGLKPAARCRSCGRSTKPSRARWQTR